MIVLSYQLPAGTSNLATPESFSYLSSLLGTNHLVIRRHLDFSLLTASLNKHTKHTHTHTKQVFDRTTRYFTNTCVNKLN